MRRRKVLVMLAWLVAGGKPTVTGKVGAHLTEEEGYKAARATILNSLAALRAEIGSLDRVRRIVKLTGWVNSAPGFTASRG